MGNLLKKFVSWLLLPTALLVGVTACGTVKTTTNQAPAPATTQNALAQVKSAGVLTIGTEGTYAPFTFRDATNQLTGFDIQLAQEVAKRIGVKAQFMETPWDGMFAGLDSTRFTMIANEVGIRADRALKYDFSSPYITSKAVLIVRTNETGIHSFQALKGKKLAESLTSNFADMARQNGATVVADQGFNDSMQLLLSGRVDGTINDSLSFLDFKKHNPNAPVQIAAEASDASKSGFMFRKGSTSLVDAVNQALKQMIQDGTYQKISEKWFGTNVLN